jgi:hypothetical protein
MRTLLGPDGDLREVYAAPRTPWLRVNMVSTIDGAASGEDGLTGSINNDADQRVFHLLRELADAVVIGAGTARSEGYPPLDQPVVVVSRSGRLPETLRGAAPGRVLMATVSVATGLEANVADPAVIELQYDASLFGGPGEPSADPAALTVGHASGPSSGYDPVATCLGRGAMPLGEQSCVDLSTSRVNDQGDVVLVVRTLTTSRWVAY